MVMFGSFAGARLLRRRSRRVGACVRSRVGCSIVSKAERAKRSKSLRSVRGCVAASRWGFRSRTIHVASCDIFLPV